MAHKPWIPVGFVTFCCSMSVVSKTLCSHFSSQVSYYGYTQAWTKLHNKVMSWISGAYECHYAWSLPEVNWTQLLCMIWWHRLWAACPCLSWSTVVVCVNLSCLHSRLLSCWPTVLWLLAHVQIWKVCIRSFNSNSSIWPHTNAQTYTCLAMQSC